MLDQQQEFSTASFLACIGAGAFAHDAPLGLRGGIAQALTAYLAPDAAGGCSLEIGAEALERAARGFIISEDRHVQPLLIKALSDEVNSDSPAEIVLAAVGAWALSADLSSELRHSLLGLVEAGLSLVDQRHMNG